MNPEAAASRLKNMFPLRFSMSLAVSYLLAEVERNHAVVLGVEDQHGTGDVIHTADTNIQGH